MEKCSAKKGVFGILSLLTSSCFFQVTYSLHLYSVNGKLRASLPLLEQPTALAVTEDFVLLGTAQCALHILHLNK